MAKNKNSTRYAESRARQYTVKELKELGWDVKHPDKNGNILEEQEAKHYDERFDELLGKDRPDFLIYLENSPVCVIECKNDKEKIQEAIDDSKYYADKLSQKYFSVKIAIGIAGNEESGVTVRCLYKEKNIWLEIKGNNYPLTQFLNQTQLQQVLLNKKPSIDLDIPTEEQFYKVAEKINKIMHEAKVNKSDRAVYLASIIIALKEGDIDTKPSVILGQINANVESSLIKYHKEDLLNIFKMTGKSDLLKKQLPLIFHNLDRLNIRALMNTGADILGKFYETFLRYGNDAKELGIVFTPRHIAKFMADLIDINSTDIVFDPACGTGGFLITAFTMMKEQVRNNTKALNKIKLEQIIGIDYEDSGKIPALAVANMIFRGDGKSNIFNENCFTFNKFKKQFATKVLMNPPYAQTETENMFIDNAMEYLKPGGLFAGIFTYAVLAEKSSAKWRKDFLSKHTILAVFTMPPDLFYPTSANACIMIAKAHISHSGKIFYARVENDGYKISRKKRVEKPGSQLPKVFELYKIKELRPKELSNPGFTEYCDLDSADDLCELVPEAYLEQPNYSKDEISKVATDLIREYGAFNIKFQDKLKLL